MSELFDVLNQELNDRFVIDSDAKAEWAMRKVAERNAERDRMFKTCDDMIAYYQEVRKHEEEKAEKENANLMFMLQEYFRSVESKSTKTQATYKLPSGKLKLKFAAPKIVASDEMSIMNQFPLYVEHVEKLKWEDFKKNLVIDDEGNVSYAVTGELVEGCKVETTPEKFVIEVD